MKKAIILTLALSLVCLSAVAQKKMKPWTEWNLKEALKMINDSPWGQTQTDTNTSEMFYAPTTRTGQNSTDSQGANNQAVNLNYHIHFLSARPIRQAVARAIFLQQKNQDKALEEQLKGFAEQKSNDWIVVAVTYESTDQRVSGKAMQIFNSSTTSTLQNETFLETKGGTRVFMKEYRAPTKDGLGAKFIFPRTVDGKPFIVPEAGFVRFQSTLGSYKINMRFNIADMVYDGQLEY